MIARAPFGGALERLSAASVCNDEHSPSIRPMRGILQLHLERRYNRCSGTKGSSRGQITRILVSLIGRSYAEERQYAVEYDAARRYFCVNRVQLRLSFAARIQRYIDNINFLSPADPAPKRKCCRSEKARDDTQYGCVIISCVYRLFNLRSLSSESIIPVICVAHYVATAVETATAISLFT